MTFAYNTRTTDRLATGNCECVLGHVSLRAQPACAGVVGVSLSPRGQLPPIDHRLCSAPDVRPSRLPAAPLGP